jgi:hypothetical protein
MKIAIIGGGWVGCHLAHKLKKDHKVILFEKNKTIFIETSSKNQNRVHEGYHYARSFNTRELCKTTINKFIYEYGFAINNVNKNYYCVPEHKSIVDYKTYLQIFNNFDFIETNHNFNNLEGCILTSEKHIDFNKIKNYFEENLSDIIVRKEINKKDLTDLSENFDLVINCTNNQLNNYYDDDFFYELTISLIYQKIKETEFDSLTMVDGKFFSIYPYKDDLFTLTDVEHTPIKKFKKYKTLKDFEKNINTKKVFKIKEKMEQKVLEYFPQFTDNFQYQNYFLAVKSKINNTSDTRYPIITHQDNVINCITGKIQGIYIIEDYINDVILRK